LAAGTPRLSRPVRQPQANDVPAAVERRQGRIPPAGTAAWEETQDSRATAYAEADHDLTNRHDQGWETRIKSHCAIACTAAEFIVEADLQAFEGDKRVFSRSWTERIPRDLM
jgi:3-mercaptopyruvate sulfurtransferase SseA